MVLPRLKSWLVVLAVFAVGVSPALAEHWWNPFAPSDVRYDFELFKAPDLSTYGDQKPNHGVFFSYERLYWSMSKPSAQLIGSTTAAPPESTSYYDELRDPDDFTALPALNTVDTGYLQALGGWGNRYEIGYYDSDENGWMVGVLDNVKQNQDYNFNNVWIQFDDPGELLDGFWVVPVTPLPPDDIVVNVGKMVTAFENFRYENNTTLGGVELMRMNRGQQLHYGGFFEIMYGARWFQLQDSFTVIGTNGLGGDPLEAFYLNPLANSRWNTNTQNNLVGPQIALRWHRQRGRWTTVLEGRFLAAANFQTARQDTSLGSSISEIMFFELFNPVPRRFTGLGANTEHFSTLFSPLGEWRVKAGFQLTKAINLKVGYTGMIVGNITRASNRTTYDSERLIGLSSGNNRSTFFVNGVDFGIEINR